MEIAPETPHRQEEIRRQQDHEQALREPDGTVYERARRQDNACGRASVRQKVHDDDGVELHREHFHGHDAEVFGLLIHFIVLPPVRFIDLERGHALQVLEECAAQTGVLVPVFCQDPLGDLLHDHDRRGDQRNAYEKDQRGLKAPRRCKEAEQCERRQERIKELRHVLAKIALQLVYSFHRLLHQLRGRDFIAIAHAEL